MGQCSRSPLPLPMTLRNALADAAAQVETFHRAVTVPQRPPDRVPGGGQPPASPIHVVVVRRPPRVGGVCGPVDHRAGGVSAPATHHTSSPKLAPITTATWSCSVRIIDAAAEAGADAIKFQSWSKNSLISSAEYERNTRYALNRPLDLRP